MIRYLKISLLLVLLVVLNGFSFATFEYAVDKYYKENIEAAYPQFKILAEQGDAKAQRYLAYIYESGEGDIEQDELLS